MSRITLPIVALAGVVLDCVPEGIPDLKAPGAPMTLQGHSQVVWSDLQAEFLCDVASDGVRRGASGMRLHGLKCRVTERHRFGLATSSLPGLARCLGTIDFGSPRLSFCGACPIG